MSFLRRFFVMYKEARRPAWVEINLSNLDFNVKSIKNKIGPNVQIIGIIKADAYGHGAYEAALVLIKNNVKTFGVATIPEAAALREKGIREEIVVLSLIPDLYSDAIIEYSLTPATCSYQNAASISESAKKAGKTVYGYIVADTGMGRIGYLPGDPNAIEEVKKISGLSNFKIKGLFSHLATADHADKTYAKEQEKQFSLFYDN